MSLQLISRSPDLKRLRDEGYAVEVKAGYLLVRHVPYVNANREIKYGVLVSDLTLAGDITTTPSDHVVRFSGAAPCDRDGRVLSEILNSSGSQTLADDLNVDHTFSSKPDGGYRDYHDKMTTYVNILSGPARSIEPDVTATTFPVVEDQDEESVFRYIDTASSRAGISLVTKKLELERIAIVGLGGTGSYVLDLVAKTPVKEIHLFDGDRFLQHNAFRSPGAPSVDELSGAPRKVAFFEAQYSKMRRHIVPHDSYLDASNVDELREMDFVFLSLDNGDAKKLAVERLKEFGVPFVDVGMGIYEVDGSLAGLVRVTSSTAQQRSHVCDKNRIPFSDGAVNNDYSHNIQIADLNALNAALAVIRWKKLFGFYLDLENEHFSAYQVDGNHLINEDRA